MGSTPLHLYLCFLDKASRAQLLTKRTSPNFYDKGRPTARVLFDIAMLTSETESSAGGHVSVVRTDYYSAVIDRFQTGNRTLISQNPRKVTQKQLTDVILATRSMGVIRKAA